MNKKTREYDLLQHIKFCLECKNESQAIRLIEKYGFVKQEERYSEKDLRKAIDFIPYHLEHGNLVARLSDKDVEDFIKNLKHE
jgi:hypothetical protein